MARSWKSPVLAAGLAAAGLAGLATSGGGPLDAAKGRAQLDVSFGPGQVEAFSDAVFVLTLRNLGTKDATLRVGDQLTIGVTSGDTASDLLADGSELTPRDPPAGFIFTPLTVESAPAGLEMALQAEIVVAPDEAIVFVFDAVSADVGSGVARIATRFSRKAGKVRRSLVVNVVKTQPAGDVFFGDGSDGALLLTSAQDGLTIQPDGNYTDVTIEAGVTVTIPSGTTIRCTGTFRNEGTILVAAGAPGGGVLLDDGFQGGVDLSMQFGDAVVPPGAGDARSAAALPSVMQEQEATGAIGGRGLGDAVFTLPLSYYRKGGGGGSAALDGIGGDGGGVLKVIARGTIVNAATGVISAAGAASTTERFTGFPGGGCGGGAGGVVILASALRVQNDGAVDVSGGGGGQPDPFGAGGGGGGGGLAVFAAPLVTDAGSVDTASGVDATAILAQPLPVVVWTGGGGGGACVGRGGQGTPVDDLGNVGPPSDGMGGFLLPEAAEPGHLVIREADPRTIWR